MIKITKAGKRRTCLSCMSENNVYEVTFVIREDYIPLAVHLCSACLKKLKCQIESEVQK